MIGPFASSKKENPNGILAADAEAEFAEFADAEFADADSFDVDMVCLARVDMIASVSGTFPVGGPSIESPRKTLMEKPTEEEEEEEKEEEEE